MNLTGVRNMGVFQLWSTVLKFIPLALMATVGLLFVKAGNFTPLEHQRRHEPVRYRWRDGDLPVQLPRRRDRGGRRRRVRNPERNVPKATDLRHPRQRRRLHVVALAVFGIVPDAELAKDSNGAVLGRRRRDRRRQLARLRRRASQSSSRASGRSTAGR